MSSFRSTIQITKQFYTTLSKHSGAQNHVSIFNCYHYQEVNKSLKGKKGSDVSQAET